MTSGADSWPTSRRGDSTGEPRVADALAAGAGLVLFSGDKLLGGPQAGVWSAGATLVARCRSNPLARALRADKLTLAALAATLALYQDPETAIRRSRSSRCSRLDPDELTAAGRPAAALCPPGCSPAPRRAGRVGGGRRLLPRSGAADHARRPGCRAARRRTGWRSDSGWVTRRWSPGSAGGRLLLDPRTLPEDAFPVVAGAIEQALARERPSRGLSGSRRHHHRGRRLPARPGRGSPPARRGRRHQAAQPDTSLVVVWSTNQSGIARGLITLDEYSATERRVDELLAGEGARLDAPLLLPPPAGAERALRLPEAGIAALPTGGRAVWYRPAPELVGRRPGARRASRRVAWGPRHSGASPVPARWSRWMARPAGFSRRQTSGPQWT